MSKAAGEIDKASDKEHDKGGRMAFNHEKLEVYRKVLSFNASVTTWIGSWDSKHALCDHLLRAAGSVLENIAMASAADSAMKTRCLDYSVGSALECAACIDLARVKQLLSESSAKAEKDALLRIMRMMVALRRSWEMRSSKVRDTAISYESHHATCGNEQAGPVQDKNCSFHHETLDAYRVGLELASGFCTSQEVAGLPNPVFRRLDELLTSILLNIAEGNGRFSNSDQRRFLGTSHEASIKMAARLDLVVTQGLLPQCEVARWKSLLERVAAMTWALRSATRGEA